jgi:molybdate transport system permease protein
VEPSPRTGSRSRTGSTLDQRPGWPALVLAALGLVLLGLPLVALAWRAPWARLGPLLGRHEVRSSLWLSLECSLGATALAAVVGLPLAWVLARWEARGRALAHALVLLPMVLPPVVGGLALLMAFGRSGLLGQWLDRWFGVTLPYTVWAAALSEAFVAMPFLVITAEAGFRSVDRRQEEVARTLGASRLATALRVTLPLAGPSVVAGLVLCWARALGEFGATITFAGDAPRTETLPLRVFLFSQSDFDAALAVSLVLLATSALVLIGLRGRWWGAWR